MSEYLDNALSEHAGMIPFFSQMCANVLLACNGMWSTTGTSVENTNVTYDSSSAANDERLSAVLSRLPVIRGAVDGLKEALLANLAILGEVPAPTFEEQARAKLLSDRFNECSLQDVSIDEKYNCVGVLPGRDSTRNILVVAHLDTPFPTTTDHTITMYADRAIGPGVGDNSLGLAVLATLPDLIEAMGIELQSNLVLLGVTHSLGRGNLQGLNFFLDHAAMPLLAGICIEGVQLGRLSYASIGMLRGEINVEIPEEYDWTRFGAVGAVQIINDVINRIQQIPLPNSPRTTIVLGSVAGGSTFNTIPTQARLRFEIRSESGEMVSKVRDAIQQITEELATQSMAQVVFDEYAHREPGGIPFGHPLVAHTRQIMNALEITPRIAPSMSELTNFIRRDIPAITLGLTHGYKLGKTSETVEIEPLATGLTQLMMVLLAIDEGLCDEH